METPDSEPDGAHSKGQPGFFPAALFGLCPRCGSRTLFAGIARFAERCTDCGLDFTRFNVGDGPAAFLTLGVGSLIMVLALWMQLALEPPFWVHIVLWVPATLVAVMAGLRGAKAALILAEYRRNASEAGDKDLRAD